ncbi:DUF4148 domain-containing protein [Roseateles sp. DAIF2]|uniref:DUF4148 domain-containing protein n=1 Tax=Roseateles sp. DAIF2 TaxID=2714952 RepID=UPI0018A263A0|nr:DUF4148 domain-containing protein [Roseateles sp. DAIF2]QPF75191.1 DUF4148 domain-containing protein [Roseateles sp. DAIF2]
MKTLIATVAATSALLGSGWALAQAVTPERDAGLPPVVVVVPAETWQAPQPERHDPSAPLSRAEVIADLNLWRQAGLTPAMGDGTDALERPGEQERLAQYQALREGPAFEAEVREVEAQLGR